MHDHGIADSDVLDGRADGVHPASILVAKRVGQLDVAFVLPLALDDMQIGAAQAGTPDTHDDIVRTGNLRIDDLLDGRPLAVSVKADGFHWQLLLLQRVAYGLHADEAVLEHECVDTVIDLGLCGVGCPFK